MARDLAGSALWVDAFVGAGGSAIALARQDPAGLVLAIDIDPRKVEMAQHNACLYGVAHRIEFVVGDFFALAPRLRAHAIHLSPPWGGPAYRRGAEYDMRAMEPRDGRELFDVACGVAPSVAYYLPSNCIRSQARA
jgi:trimethylguanosine synthase